MILMTLDTTIEIENASRWYGEILGINKVTAQILPGITGLLGPNGAGKSTLMNLICGLLRPSHGCIHVFGETVWNNPAAMRRIGFCTQHDRFYENMTGYEFLRSLLSLRGYQSRRTAIMAEQALDVVQMTYAMNKKIASYSKGMRQRVKVALAISDNPDILVLDEPLNGLDAVGRHDMIGLVRQYAGEGRIVVISSHVLHEIEDMTESILMMRGGYLLAEGDVRDVRELLRKHPHKIYIRCRKQRPFAARLVEQADIVSVSLLDDASGLVIETCDLDAFYTRLNSLVLEDGFQVDVVTVSDENIQSVFRYLAENEHA